MANPQSLSLFQVAEVELVYRNKIPVSDRISIVNSVTAYDTLMSAWDMNKIELVEEFKIILLDTASRCIGISDISRGGISGCVVDPRIVFSTALKAKASALILSHNHPSGNLTPSDADIKVTHKLAEGGNVLDIKILDHLIVTPTHYCSMQDDKLMPSLSLRF